MFQVSSSNLKLQFYVFHHVIFFSYSVFSEIPTEHVSIFSTDTSI